MDFELTVSLYCHQKDIEAAASLECQISCVIGLMTKSKLGEKNNDLESMSDDHIILHWSIDSCGSSSFPRSNSVRAQQDVQ